MVKLSFVAFMLVMAGVPLLGAYQKLRDGVAPWRRPLTMPQEHWDASREADPNGYADDQFLARRNANPAMFWISVGLNVFFAAIFLAGAGLVLFGVVPVVW